MVLKPLQHAYAAHVSYVGGAGTLVVSHDGAGIKDLAILAKIDACNWTPLRTSASVEPHGSQGAGGRAAALLA